MMASPFARRLLSIGLLLAFFASPWTLRAQSTDERASARALALEGSTAFKEKRWEDALRFFTRAEELVHAPPHLLFAAKAHLELKHLVDANDLLLKVKNETLPANAPPAFQRAQEEAFELLQQIKPRLSYLAVDVSNAGTQPLEIQVDSVKLGALFRGVPKAVNPGEHKVSAIADGMRAPEITVQVAEGERKKVDLELKPDASARLTPVAAPAPASADPAAPAAPAPGDAAPTPGTDQGPAPEGKPGWLKIAPYAALGVGAVGLGLGTVFGLGSASKRSEADDYEKASCSPCSAGSPQAKKLASLDKDAGSAQTLSIVGFVVGGVGVATGVTLLVLDVGGGGTPKEQGKLARGVTLSPVLGLGSAGVSGTF